MTTVSELPYVYSEGKPVNLDTLPVSVHDLGLTFHRDITDDQEWLGIGRQLFQEQGTQYLWRVGDWLQAFPTGQVYRKGHEGAFPNPIYNMAEELTGFDRPRLKLIKCVAGKYPLDQRVKGLSFTHHQHAYSLPPDERQVILKRALDEGWTTRDIMLKARAQKTRAKSQPKIVSVTPFVEQAKERHTGTAEFTLTIRSVRVSGKDAKAACHEAEERIKAALQDLGEVEFQKGTVLLGTSAPDRFYKY